MALPHVNDRIFLDRVGPELAKMRTLEQVLSMRDEVVAIRRSAQFRELRRLACEAMLLCERRIGALLPRLRLRGGDRKSAGWHKRPTLAALGIRPDQSARWQKAYTVSQEIVEAYLLHAASEDREATSGGLLRFAADRGWGTLILADLR